jgi:ATP-dependent Clp protease, protease subunit
MTNGILPQAPQPLKEVYGFVVGVIDQQAVQRIANAVTIATNSGVEWVHLLFQTSGGMVGDGICVYNIFRAAPMTIKLYNAGSIASVGVIAYLGASERNTSANATFMIHKTFFSPIGATSDRLQAAANAAILDDQRVESILHKHISLTEESWGTHKVADLWLSADEALKVGLATKIEEFSPPKGQTLFYLGPP